MSALNAAPIRFNFFRFVGPRGNRTTELVRDYSQADCTRGLLPQDRQAVEMATQRVHSWATTRGFPINPQEPFPSREYPGKVWDEFRLRILVSRSARDGTRDLLPTIASAVGVRTMVNRVT